MIGRFLFCNHLFDYFILCHPIVCYIIFESSCSSKERHCSHCYWRGCHCPLGGRCGIVSNHGAMLYRGLGWRQVMWWWLIFGCVSCVMCGDQWLIRAMPCKHMMLSAG